MQNYNKPMVRIEITMDQGATVSAHQDGITQPEPAFTLARERQFLLDWGEACLEQTQPDSQEFAFNDEIHHTLYNYLDQNADPGIAHRGIPDALIEEYLHNGMNARESITLEQGYWRKTWIGIRLLRTRFSAKVEQGGHNAA